MEENYQQFIEKILKSRGRHGCKDDYYEKHHIKPKCLGGQDEEENMIDLFAKEHYKAHELLAKENPKEKGLQFAWFCMSIMRNQYTNKRYRCSAEEYEEAKKAMANSMSEITKGRIVSEETKEKHRKQVTGPNNPMYGKLGASNPNYGRVASEKTKEKIRKNHPNFSGANHPQCRAVYCVETNKMYWGAKAVQDELNININCVRDCCQGRQQTAGGYHWEYVDGNGKNRHTNNKPVKCIETGQIFWSIYIANKLLGIDNSDIVKCCKNQKKTAGGYHWEYVNKK